MSVVRWPKLSRAALVRRRASVVARRGIEVLEGRVLLAGDSLATAVPIEVGEAISAQIGEAGEVDYYEIALAEAGRLTVRTRAEEAGLESRTSLLGTAGQLLIQSDGESGENRDDLIIQHLIAGKYFLRVEDPGGGTGAYTLSGVLEPATPPSEPLVTNFVADFPAGLQPPFHTSGDFNGDGNLDVATANYYTDDVSLFLGLGDGTFQSARTIPLAFIEGTFRGPFGITSADFNGDGRLDLATGNQFSADVSVLLGLGDGTFGEEVRVLGGAFNWGMTTGDFNGDRIPDLAASNTFTDDVSIFLGKGDGTFEQERRFAVGGDPTGLSTADFNGDGRLDVVTANFVTSDVSVLLGRGDGTFEEELRFTAGVSPSDGVATGDFDGDGDIDLATPNAGSGDVSVLLGRGDGTFEEAVHYPAGENPYGIVAGDFNGDGALDLANANRQSNDVSILLGRGDGTFAGQVRYRAGLQPWHILAGDVNNDGRLDLTTANARSHDVSVLVGLGDGTFHEDLTEPREAETNPQGLVGRDFNGDGHLDLATVTFLGGDAFVFLGRGDGTFQQRVRFSVGSTPVEMVAADFNGDGLMDLATANCDSGDVSVLLGLGDGTFRDEQRYGGAPSSEFIIAADFNGDGLLDLVTGGQFAPGAAIVLGRTDGTFEDGLLFALGDAAGDAVAADFNEDGHLDVAFSNIFSAEHDVSIHFGRGDGTFQSGGRFAVGEQPLGLVTADFNGDGHADLANANFGSDSVSVLLGRGDGGFEREVRFASGPLPDFLMSRDVNDDGRLDLVVSNSGSNTISVLPGRGDGTFEDEVQFIVGDGPTPRRGIEGGDFNGDGLVDLAFPQVLSSDVSILPGAGHGHFGAPLRFPVGLGPTAIVTGDFSSDGRLDVVSVNPTANEVAVALGAGDTTLQTPVYFSAGLAPIAVVHGDFNGDGRLDVATANHGSSDVSVLLGLGTGAFREEVRFAVGANPVALASGDFNGDGRLDLASANIGSDDVSLLLGNGDGTFRSYVSYAAGDLPQALEAADFNGDGLLDLATANYADNDVTLLFGVGTGGFGAPVAFRVGEGPVALLVDDFDGDGLADLATANYLSNDVSVLIGEGGGAFRGVEHIAAGTNPISLTDGDFNGDGLLDLGAANSLSDDVTLLLGVGDGRFTDSRSFSVGNYPADLVAGDFNADGRVDLALASHLAFDVSILPGLGDGKFLGAGTISAPLLSAPVVLDWNADGVSDVAVVGRGGEILLRLGRPGSPGVFDAPLALNQGTMPARDLALVRSGDGLVLAALEAVSSTVSFYSRRADGTVQRSVGPAVPGALPVRLVAGDLNGDARDDLVVVASGSAEVFVYLQGAGQGAAGGRFGAAPTYRLEAGQIPSDVALADVDGDGRPDLVVPSQVSGDVTVFRNTAESAFASQLRYRAGTGLYYLDAGAAVRSREGSARVIAGNFDTDALVELVVVNSGSNSFSVLNATENGGLFNAGRELTFAAGDRPALAVWGRFNDDGHADLAVLNARSSDISVYLGDGSGGFAELGGAGTDGAGLRISAGNVPSGLAAADVTGDGVPDLLVSNEFGDLLILPGNGDGTFAPYRRAGQNIALAVADLNGDGLDDFIFANESRDRVSVQYSRPGQAFAQERADGLLAPGAVSSADLNGDGASDLVVANSGGNDVLVYLGSGGGQFGAARSFFAGTNPAGITIQDLNGDGGADLVVANEGSNDVTVLLGRGQGADWSFSDGPRLRAGTGPVSTAVQDMTGDAIPDILVSNRLSNDVFLLPGVGGGFFDDRNPFIRGVGTEPGPVIPVGSGVLTVNRGSNDVTFIPHFFTSTRLDIETGGLEPVAAATGDFDGDGRFDVMVANQGDGVVSLLIGDAESLALSRTFRHAGVRHPTALAVSTRDGEVEVYVAEEGRESAILLTSFGIAVASPTARDAAPVTDVFLVTGRGFREAANIFTTAAEGDGAADEPGDSVAALVDEAASAEQAEDAGDLAIVNFMIGVEESGGADGADGSRVEGYLAAVERVRAAVDEVFSEWFGAGSQEGEGGERNGADGGDGDLPALALALADDDGALEFEGGWIEGDAAVTDSGAPSEAESTEPPAAPAVAEAALPEETPLESVVLADPCLVAVCVAAVLRAAYTGGIRFPWEPMRSRFSSADEKRRLAC